MKKVIVILLVLFIFGCSRQAELPHDKGGRPLLLGGLRFITAVSVSPDGKSIATGSVDRRVRIWDAKSGGVVRVLKGHTDDLTGIAWFPGGKKIISGSMDSTLRIWDTGSGRCIGVLTGHRDEVLAVGVSPDGNFIASGSLDGSIRIWDGHTGKCLRELPGSGGPIEAISFAGDGKYVYSADLDGNIYSWKTGDKDLVLRVRGSTAHYNSVSIDAGNSRAVFGAKNGEIIMIDLNTGRVIHKEKIVPSPVTALAFMPGGEAAAGFKNGMIVLINPDGTIRNKIQAHSRAVTALSSFSDGRLVSGSTDRKARLWNSQGKLVKELRSDRSDIYCLLFHNGKLLGGRGDGVILDCSEPENKKSFRITGKEPVNEMCAAGNNIVAALSSGSVILFSGENSKPENIIKFNLDADCVAYSPDVNVLVAGSEGGEVFLYKPAGKEKIEFDAHPNTVTRVRFSPDGRLLCTSSCDNTVRVWDLKDLKLIRILKGHDDEVWDIRFIGNEKVVSASSDRTVRVWDLRTGLTLNILKGHEDSVSCIALSPDKKYMATASWDGMVGIWDTGKWLLVKRLKAGEELLYVIFMPDGRLAACGVNDSVFIWNEREWSKKD
ncbi:MAG: WD40 repeat domain-containing protein [Chloroflexi bacterium]|nr:WD40 repeat domain-containing protein [Chloroflexota bacterium]